MNKGALGVVLAALGVPVAPNEFVAGMLLALIGYYIGSELFRRMGEVRIFTGLLCALMFALMVAIMHEDYLFHWHIQVKMTFVAFFTFPILLLLRNIGEAIPGRAGAILDRFLAPPSKGGE